MDRNWPWAVEIDVGGEKRPFGSLDLQTIWTLATSTSHKWGSDAAAAAQAWSEFADVLEELGGGGVAAMEFASAAYWAGRLRLTPPEQWGATRWTT